MTENSVPEADGLKLLRDGGPGALLSNPKSGGRPKRKKAFYRAWKRHELLAICSSKDYIALSVSNQFCAVYADVNCLDGHAFVMYPWHYGNNT